MCVFLTVFFSSKVKQFSAHHITESSTVDDAFTITSPSERGREIFIAFPRHVVLSMAKERQLRTECCSLCHVNLLVQCSNFYERILLGVGFSADPAVFFVSNQTFKPAHVFRGYSEPMDYVDNQLLKVALRFFLLENGSKPTLAKPTMANLTWPTLAKPTLAKPTLAKVSVSCTRRFVSMNCLIFHRFCFLLSFALVFSFLCSFRPPVVFFVGRRGGVSLFLFVFLLFFLGVCGQAKCQGGSGCGSPEG